MKLRRKESELLWNKLLYGIFLEISWFLNSVNNIYFKQTSGTMGAGVSNH